MPDNKPFYVQNPLSPHAYPLRLPFCSLTTNPSDVDIPHYLHVHPFCMSTVYKHCTCMPDNKPVKFSLSTLPACLSFLPVSMHTWQQTCHLSTLPVICPLQLSICTPDNKPVKYSLSTPPACLSFLPVYMHAWQQTCQMLTVNPTCMSILYACLYARLTTNLSNVHRPPYLHG